MELSCLLGTTRRVPEEKFPRKPYNKSFIGQACSVKMAGHLPRFFVCVSVHKHTKKGTWPISSHLDRTSLVNNPYILCISVEKQALLSTGSRSRFFAAGISYFFTFLSWLFLFLSHRHLSLFSFINLKVIKKTHTANV